MNFFVNTQGAVTDSRPSSPVSPLPQDMPRSFMGTATNLSHHALMALGRSVEPVLKRVAPATYDRVRARRLGRSYPEYFDSTQSIFVHIPKCAGTSVAMALYGRSVGHFTWQYWLGINPRKFAAYFKFAVIRDPLERFVSSFRFLKAGGMNDGDKEFATEVLSRYAGPEDLARAMVDPELQQRVLSWWHFRPQADFVTDEHGRCRVDLLVRYESLPAAFGQISRRINPGCQLPHLNRTDSPQARLLDDAAIDVLKCIYQRDFRLCPPGPTSQPIAGSALRAG